MGATSTDSTASVVASLTNSFNSVPHAAIPPLLDCVLTSTGISSSSLFDSLLNAFSDFLKDFLRKDNGQSVSSQSSYISSFTTALCYLLKNSGTDPSALQSFILRGYLPVMKSIKANDHQLLNLIAEELSEVVTESNTWKVMEASLVTYSLRSVGISIGMHQSADSAIYEWNEHLLIHGIDSMLTSSNMDADSISLLNGSMPLDISCHILTSLLVASLRNWQILESPPESVLLTGHPELFCKKMLWDICPMIITMLSQCPDHRSCATHLLPFILRIFARHSSFRISVQGKIQVFSRDIFFREIWKCCQALFCLGPAERADAYSVLSLYISTFYHKEGHGDITVCNEVEEFDIRMEQEFWDEIKRGLVAKEAFVRKQSLNMLKLSLSEPDESHCDIAILEKNLVEDSSTSLGLTRRGKWAENEAKSLGVGKTHSFIDTHSNGKQRWDAFVLLYEMLEEYGTHLVEAAWGHQISILLRFSCEQHSSSDVISGAKQSQMETLEGMFSWLAVLWERGLCHENPQVRCLIMQSILSISWKDYGTCAKLVPETFLIGPFMQGLNDPVHHKEFGVKGVYSSETIEGATTFVSQYCKHMQWRVRIALMGRLASLVREESFGRAGLMALSACIASAAYGVQCGEACSAHMDQQESAVGDCNSEADLLDMLRLVTESCKQHFNLNYRHRVSEYVLEAASSVICASDVPLETLLHFISSVPRESTDYGGSLRGNVKKWLSKCSERWRISDSFCKMHVIHNLCDYPRRFVEHNHPVDAPITYDDGDTEAWESEAQRWTRVFFLVITEGRCLEVICEFLQNYGAKICEHNHLEWLPLKFLILNIALVQELQIMKMKFKGCEVKVRSNQEPHMLGTSDLLISKHIYVIFEKLTHTFLYRLEELVQFANIACSKFWCCPTVDSPLPPSVRGRLGGPSQRRLPSSATTAILESILSMKTVGFLSTWCAQFRSDHSLDSAFTCLWRYSQKVILSPMDDVDSETGAEIRLAAYEALVPVLKSVASSMTPMMFSIVMADDKSLLSKDEDRPWLDTVLLSFLQNINGLIAHGTLSRSRRAILMNWKWLCLNSLLSILHCVIESEVQFGSNTNSFSTASMKFIYSDLIGSLENASESSVLPMLRSVRLVFGLFASGRLGLTGLSSDGINTEMLWELISSSWILHVNCNKRKIAHIAALLSSVLHYSIFHDERMHETAENMQGPYKWFIEKILEEGTKSPRTIRLAALHLTGLWLMYPKTIRYYIKELKLLSLYGSVAFDEDFEAELAESQDASIEVSLLAKGSETELTEAFINTELYARVCVAVLFHQLANFVDKLGSVNEIEDCHAALHAGKAFLLELLDSAVNDTDLAKELYKKYSGIHRRKVRAWQMICILSRFVDEDIVQQVTSNLHICLYRNNMPSVRQYLEIFAIQIYLKFPSLVNEQLSPILRDYNMRPQALSSYVFIAANVILHTTEENIQHRHLNELLPLITPLLTSHHHSLRGFSQLLVYKVLSKMVPSLDSDDPSIMPLEKRCFVDLKSYLAKNTDCVRLRASMEGFLDAFDSSKSATPAGLFTSRDEGVDFECVPTSLMEQVNTFLNEVREDLRSVMAKDMVIIKNESLFIGENCNSTNISLMDTEERVPSQVLNDVSVDFQKKITLSKHEKQSNGLTSMSSNKQLCEPLFELEKEDQLLNHGLQSRSLAMEKLKSSRQEVILVASLIDRIPNLAGLARTCEVFSASCLAVSDAGIIKDKQFQLISVTAEKWVPIIEVPVNSMKVFLKKKKQEGFSILGLEQTANSVPLDQYAFPKKMVLVLGREKEGIPVDIIHILDACIEIPQLGVVRSLNVHVSGAIALWEYTRQQRVQHF